ncbi:hypothetical protein SLNSH_17035 [Alsobacter soli]|uniref:Terminase small subunit n=1 Tax=Alsobacter soli TaxID=2109933 RepID=A0A2T1HQ79_9HYPH|nr:hypothetical protein [Alsobacter soli]PSC03814.1 hypothetical protein SLNSH_17035 [Alsobacter soli]
MSEKRVGGRPRKALKRYENGRLNEKREALVEALIWKALPLAEAAQHVGMSMWSAREAMRIPAVMQHLEAERRALLAGERIRNLQALVDVRDNSANANARVNAVKELEAMAADVGAGTARERSAGYVIEINVNPDRATGRVAPVIELQANRDEDEFVDGGRD